MQLRFPESRPIHMRLVGSVLSGLLVLGSGALAASSSPPNPAPQLTPREKELLSSLPVRFEQDKQHRWTAHGAGYSFLFDRSATILRLGNRALKLSFTNSNANAPFEALDPTGAPANYFIGKNYRSVQGFSRLRRADIYTGIDAVYYGNGDRLEYDFDLAPGADASQIRMRFEGADRVSVNARGEIELKLGSGNVIQRLPVAYQTRASGKQVPVKARYRLAADGTISLALGSYDRSKALVIDPSMVYAAYLGGSNADAALAIAHDSKGFVYLGGYTYSSDFPAFPEIIFQQTGTQDAWVMKLNPFAASANDVVVYSVYFGGNLDDNLTGLAVDSNGLIYFGGVTLSSNLHVTGGAFQAALANTNGINEGYVAVLDPTRSGTDQVIYCSYFGATQTVEVNSVAVAGGKLYVTGWTNSPDFPVTGNAYRASQIGGYDAFVAEFDPTQSGSASLPFSSYLGGTQEDIGRSIAADAAGNAWVAGLTLSPDFPTVPNAFRPGYLGGGDAFLAELNPANGALVYSTFVGGSGADGATSVVADPSGHVAVSGYTFSPDLPLTPNAGQAAYGGGGDAFLTVLDPSKSGSAGLVYASYFGGSGAEVPYGLALDPAGRYYICGYTLSQDLPVSVDAIAPTAAAITVNGFVAAFNPSGAVEYASYITSAGYQIMYGVATDSQFNVYLTGIATGDIFPNGVPSNTGGAGNINAFIYVFTLGPPASPPVAPTQRLGRRRLAGPGEAQPNPLVRR
ncbi:MAG TPA: SBBP repeat-containing protein [Bryobacteraceae bacterium]|nr:SBBP repeat-containing protein [Bryobacteraceae bacterium]